MHYDIGAQVEWILQIRRSESIVNTKEKVVFLRNICHRRNVSNINERIRWSFRPNEFSVLVDTRTDILRVRHINIMKLESEPFEYFCKQTIGTTIHVVARDDFITWL